MRLSHAATLSVCVQGIRKMSMLIRHTSIASNRCLVYMPFHTVVF